MIYLLGDNKPTMTGDGKHTTHLYHTTCILDMKLYSIYVILDDIFDHIRPY
jgi:hypothetical protein